jgi:hypothetical protein
MQFAAKRNTSVGNTCLIFNTVSEGIRGYKREMHERSTGPVEMEPVLLIIALLNLRVEEHVEWREN